MELQFDREGNSRRILPLGDTVLVYRDRKSNFIEPFWKPGQKPSGVLCCQFYEAKWSNGCLFACEYCYLKGTFRQTGWRGKEQTVFSNEGQLMQEVERFLEKEEPNILNTGEVADSLAVPGSDRLMAKLVERFGSQDRHTLLLLTKSNNIKALLGARHNSRTVIGFSINPQTVAGRFEIGAASTSHRLKAAHQCIKAGYRVMVRVDPMIPIEGWEQEYEDLFETLNGMHLYGVVVGTLRAYPGLLPRMSIELRSFLTDRDVDRRYHIAKELRWSMYRFAFGRLRFNRMGICKESGKTWGKLVNEFRDKRFLCNCRL